MTEAEIIKGCISHNAVAQKVLYLKYAPVLKTICLRYIKDREEAKDVLQDCFIKIFQVIGKYKNEGSFEGWLKRIVIHVTLDYLRKSKKVVFTQVGDTDIAELTASGDSVTDLILNAGFTANSLMDMLHKLHPEFSSVFNMYYIDNLSHKEIGEMLKIDENTSRTRLFRAKLLLKKELEAEVKKRQHAQMF